MSASWRDYLLLFGAVAILWGCGGGGGSGGVTEGLPPAGSMLNTLTVSPSATTTVTAKDPTTGATLTIPAGAVQTGAKVQLVVWSSQRGLAAPVSEYTPGAHAFDVVLNPTQVNNGNPIIVQLPGQTNTSPFPTVIVAFGPSGQPCPLLPQPNATAESPSAQFGLADLQALFPTTLPNAPTTIEFAVETPQPPAAGAGRSHAPALKRLGHVKPTTYANKTRIAVIVPGFLDDIASASGLADYDSYPSTGDLFPMASFFSGSFPTQGTAGTSPAFDPDEVWVFQYDWTQSVETNGELLAGLIDANWGSAMAFEVHLFGHSVGGLVARWAVEKAGVASATQVVTLGTPHTGIPHALLGPLEFLVAFSGVSIGQSFSDVADDSKVMLALAKSQSSKIVYQAVGGSSSSGLYPIHVGHTGTTFNLGDFIGNLYVRIAGVPVQTDGLVALSSAVGLANARTATVAYNHSLLVADIAKYWPTAAGSWLYGMNRNVNTVQIGPANATGPVGATLAMSATPFDKDGVQITPTLIDVNFQSGLPVTWSVDNSSIATIDPLTGILACQAAGTVNVTAVTASTVPTTTGLPISVTAPVVVTPTPSFSLVSLGNLAGGTPVVANNGYIASSGGCFQWSDGVVNPIAVPLALPESVNENGVFAGQTSTGGIATWSSSAGLTQIFADSARVTGITGANTVAGYAPNLLSVAYSFTWSKGALVKIPGYDAIGMSDSGVVAVVNNSFPFTLSGWQNGAIVWNDSWLHPSTWNNACSRDGRIAGQSRFTKAPAFRNPSNALIDLGLTPAGDPTQYVSGFAVSVNSNGDAVGYLTTTTGSQAPFAYIAGVLYNATSLLPPGAQVGDLRLWSINDQRLIVGSNNNAQLVLLAPAPAPARQQRKRRS